MNELTKLIRIALVTWRADRAAREEAAEKAVIAKAFNDRYTYRKRWREDITEQLPGTAYGGLNPMGGYAWMCPECNRVHLAIGISVFDGLHYPACCSSREGNRSYRDIRYQ